MTNSEIKQLAHQAVIRHERRHGWKAVPHQTGEGYDILSRRGKDERHIEVKGTTRTRPHFRHLTRNEVKAWKTDKRWYLYCVCDIGGKARVHKLGRADLRGRVERREAHTISFKKEDFD